MGAVAPAHQDAILVVAQIGNGYRKPDPNARQQGCKRNSGSICEHPVAIVIRFCVALLITGEIIGKIKRIFCSSTPVIGSFDRQPCECPRSEFQNTRGASGGWRRGCGHQNKVRKLCSNISMYGMLGPAPKLAGTVGAGIPGIYSKTGDDQNRDKLFWDTAHHVKFVVGSHFGDAGHPIR
jgi:hypothetical protein